MSHAKFYLIGRYFSVHLTTNIGDVKLSINVVYGRNGLLGLVLDRLNGGLIQELTLMARRLLTEAMFMEKRFLRNFFFHLFMILCP